MSEEKYELCPRPLKNAGSKKIEEAIAKAASELVGEEYVADISSIDFKASNYADYTDACEIKVRISRKKNPLIDSIGGSPTTHSTGAESA